MAEREKAILYLTRLICNHETHESGSDEIYFRVFCDGELYGKYPTNNNVYKMHTEDVERVDLEIECTYLDEVAIQIYERDDKTSDGEPSDKDEFIGWVYIKRGDELDANNCGSRKVYQYNGGPGIYTMEFRVISDPIPTVRVFAIRCEQQSAGMNEQAVSALVDIAEDCTKAAGKMIKKSPRPRAKIIGDAFIAASKLLKGVEAIADWIGRIIEGRYDEVYMKHEDGTSSRSYGITAQYAGGTTRTIDGGFFPPNDSYYKLKSEDEVYFEEEYGYYFRFPLDLAPVTLTFMEHDGGKADVNIGMLTIYPDQVAYGTSQGLFGEENQHGLAEMDGPAVVEVADSYGDREGEGAIYQICYGIGMEDWCLPATTDGQLDANDEVEPETVTGRFLSPRGPVSYASAKADCTNESGHLPEVEELVNLFQEGRIPDSWPTDKAYWANDNYFIDLVSGAFSRSDDGTEDYYYSCKQDSDTNEVEGWDGSFGFSFKAPEGMVDLASAEAVCADKAGSLPEASVLQQLITEGKIPESWPEGEYWVDGGGCVDISDGTLNSSIDPDKRRLYTCAIEHLSGDQFTKWPGQPGHFCFPMETNDYAGAVTRSADLGGTLPSSAQLSLLIQQGAIPSTWPTGKYWTLDNEWVDIQDIDTFGSSADGSESYYYSSLVNSPSLEVETNPGVITSKGYFCPPLNKVDYQQAEQECVARGGQLPTLETIRLMIEQGEIPEEWPKDSYYYTENKYMVNINAIFDKEDVLQPILATQPCYYICQLGAKAPEVHGHLTAPKYLVPADLALSECAAQNGRLPGLEELQGLIAKGDIPNSWLKGHYWAGASDNTLFLVDIKTGDYSYFPSGKSENFYCCLIEGQADEIEAYQPGEGWYTFPETQGNFDLATQTCLSREGEMPTADELQLIFQQDLVENLWPIGKYWAANKTWVSNTRSLETGTSSTGSEEYYITCKQFNGINGVQTGAEVFHQGYMYTYPRGFVGFEEAKAGCEFQGGTLPCTEELMDLALQGLAPESWPYNPFGEDWYYWANNKILVRLDPVGHYANHYSSNDDPSGVNPHQYTAKIKIDGSADWLSGAIKSPVFTSNHYGASDISLKRGERLLSPEELKLLIKQGRIPNSWPRDLPYHAGKYETARYLVDIQTGDYHDTWNDSWSEGYFCSLDENGLDRVEEGSGVTGYFFLPGEPGNYLKAVADCELNDGQLATVQNMRTILRSGQIPPNWPKSGKVWLRGQYIMELSDGSFSHSQSGLENCPYICNKLDGALGMCEVEWKGNSYTLLRDRTYPWEEAKAYCESLGGVLPTLEEFQELSDEGLIAPNWPSPQSWSLDQYWVSLRSSPLSYYKASLDTWGNIIIKYTKKSS